MSNSINSVNTTNFSGMVSGMDTDTLVKEMVANYQSKVDDLKGEKQQIQWQKEDYGQIMEDLKQFSNKYLDVLNRDDYILSMAGTKQAVFSDSDLANNIIDIKVNSDAVSNSYTINAIDQLATSASITSSDKVIGFIQSQQEIDFTSGLDLSGGYDFELVLDGLSQTITLDANYNDQQSLLNGLNEKLTEQFGNDRVTASISENKLRFEAANSIIQVRTTGENSFLEKVAMTSGQRNIVNLDRSASELFGESERIEFNINQTEFSFSKDSKIRDIMDEINRSKANVRISYSSFNDKFSMKSKASGASSKIEIENINGSFFGDTGYSKINQTNIQNGQDAIIYLNDEGQTNPIRRSSNVFSNDGVSFVLKELTSSPIEFRVSQNTEGVYDKIEGFVEDFNQLIGKLEGKLKEKKNLEYQPLTEAQKEEMSDKQIELWEEKARSGLLRNDQTIYRLVNDLKSAFWDKTSSSGTSFFEAGITTSNNYHKFELTIDREKLETAIAKDANGVLKLFNQASDINYSRRLSKADASQRYDESGFAHRISDIIEKNVSSLRNNSNAKGVLVELIGLEGDTTEVNNVFKQRVDRIDTRITDALKRMRQREATYRRQFTAMEQAIQRMSMQGDAIYNMFMQE